MAPRFTFLIIVGIVAYVSLSVYHWRQVKKIPGTEKQSAVHAVLSRDSREKNWVQVSTSPGLSGENAKNLPAESTTAEEELSTDQPAIPAADPLPEISLAADDKTISPPSQDTEIFRSENDELRRTLQHERSINHRQAQEINDLHAQIIALRSALDDTSAGQGKIDSVQQKPHKQSPDISVDLEGFDAEKSQVNTLKTILAAKADALAKANERITGLAARLDQSRRTLAEAENTNIYLQTVLTNTENGKIKARQEAGQFRAQFVAAREDREKYLAETGRLHAQLQQAKSRLARLENELSKTRLASEAMLRYGKEQTELITPFRQQIEIMNARVDDKNSELLRAEDQISQLREKEQLLQNEIQALLLELQKSEANNETLQAKSQTLNSVQKHADELTGQLQVLADQLNVRDEKISILTKALEEAQTTTQNAAHRSDILKKESEQQQQELDTARQELATHQQQLDASTVLQQSLETELATIREINEQHSSKIEEQAKLLEAASSDSLQLTSRLQETGDRLVEAENALHSSQTALQELQTTQQQVSQADTSEAGKTIRQLQGALDTAQSRLAGTGAELQTLKQSLAKAETRQSDDTARTKLQQEIDQLRKSIADKDLQQKTAEQTISELKSDNRILQEKITAAEQANKEKAEFESTLAQKVKDLNLEQERTTILESEGADLRSELDRRETAFFKMQEEYTSLQDRVDSLQRERDTFFPYTLDSDSDTISDAQDICPGTVQGAKVGADGCEYDNDNDGVVDRLDLCPETSGESDTNTFGCTKGEHIVLSGIFFSGGNADLSSASQSYLDKVADVLELDPDTRFEVAGHTDSTGEPARNLTVSRQRAGVVTDYLVNKGIEAGRLVPVGYGPEQPVADNVTQEGRAANRRVELRMIQPIENPASSAEDEPVTNAEEEGLPAR